jgi:hypothetical protein
MAESKEEQKKLLAGKYKDVDALEQGYLRSSQEAQKLIAYTRKLEQQNEQLGGLLNSMQAEKAASGGGNEPSLEDPEGLKRWLADQVQTLTASQVEQLLTPVIRSVEAASELGAEDSTYMRGDPELLETFNTLSAANPQAAAVLVKKSRELDELKRQLSQASQDDRQAATAREAALADAGVGDASRGDSRQKPVETDNDEAQKLGKLAEHAQEHGDRMPLLRERLFGGKKPVVELWAPGEAPPPSMLPDLMKPQE